MKKSLLIVIFAIFSILVVEAQSIRIVRTDVDSSRLSFVTATLKFGFNVYLDDVQSSNGVAFQLNYSKNDVIKYSEFQAGDFGKPIVIPMTNPDGSGRIVVGVTTGTNPLPDSIKSPRILHLEFVVLQTAINLDTAIFEFVNPVATIQKNGIGETVTLTQSPIHFTIHSFVNVWPGDADNNGIVDHLDFAPVSQFNGLGPMTKNMRSFKRKSQSSIWAPHRVLTWDSASVTFADCDGNGDITYADMLIVSYNLGKDSLIKSIQKNDAQIQENYPVPTRFSGTNLLKIPINFSSNSNFYAAMGKIHWESFSNYAEILGIEPSDVFNETPYCYFNNNTDEKTIEFAVGSYTKALPSTMQGILAYLIVKPFYNKELYSPIPEYLTAINENGNLFSLKATSGIDDNFNNDDIKISQTLNDIVLSNTAPFEVNFSMFSINGEQLKSGVIAENQLYHLNKGELSTGIYIIIIQNGEYSTAYKVAIIN